MVKLLQTTGERLGFAIQTKLASSGARSVRWTDSQAQQVYQFFVIASAVLGSLLLDQDPSTRLKDAHVTPIVALPGGRSALVEHKLACDPRLVKAMQSWRLIKFRHVRRLADDPLLNRENLEAQLELDPLQNQDAQMALL
jgi:hypothetical protein